MVPARLPDGADVAVAHNGQAWGRGVNTVAERVLASRKQHQPINICKLDNSAWARRWRYLIACGWLIVLASALGCAHDSPIDALCIKGQLSAAQAASLDPHQYETLPSYCAEGVPPGQHGGDAHCQAERFDRVLAAHCSGALK